MTIIDTATGEVLDVETAERRASYICTDLDMAADSFETAMTRMREAIAERDDLVLGYRSPGEYLSDRFGGRLARLGVDLRREVVRELTEAGLSTRAIAPIVGTSFKTVARDIAAPVSSDTPQTPEPADDGEADAGSGQAPEDEVTPSSGNNEVEVAVGPAPRPPVVGIDGKTYTRPTPISHHELADRAVSEFPELAYYRDLGDLEHCWRLAATLRQFGASELSERLSTLRRSIEVDRSKRAGTYQRPAQHVETCPACGQTIKDN